MKKEKILLEGIPVVKWGEDSSKIFLAVHGSMSNKEDNSIQLLAEKIIPLGYEVLSFDLPKHGERKDDKIEFKLQNCVNDLKKVIENTRGVSKEISLFACSMGAYLSLIAFNQLNYIPKKSLFLSPVVDMGRVLENMMKWTNITEERLRQEKEIKTEFGQIIYWDCLCYTKENLINKWESKTSILYGEQDEVCERDIINSFSTRFDCKLDIVKDSKHYFHTDKENEIMKNWFEKNVN